MRTRLALTMLVGILLTTSVGIGIFDSALSAAPVPGDPVPGVDVSIEQSPSGIIIASTQTNSSGAFKFEKLTPGKYKLKYGRLPGQTASTTSARASNNYNSAKSNTAGVAMGTANETWNVTIEINPDDVQPGQNPGILIEIGPRGGSVKGVVTKTSPQDRRGRGVATGGRGGAFSTIQPTNENSSNSRVKGEADQVAGSIDSRFPGVDVSLQSADGTIRKTKTDALGNYTFTNVPPGDWKLYLGSPPPPPGAKAAIATSLSNRKSPPQLLAGTTNHYKLDIQVEAEKTVSGPNQGTAITIGGNRAGQISGRVTCVDAKSGQAMPGTRCTRFQQPEMKGSSTSVKP